MGSMQFKYLLKLKSYNGNFTEPTNLLNYILQVVTSNDIGNQRTLECAHYVCKDIGVLKEKFKLGMAFTCFHKTALTSLYEMAGSLKLSSTLVIGLASIISGNTEHEQLGFGVIAERLGFSDLKLFSAFMHFIRGNTFDKNYYVELSNACQIDESYLTLLSISKKQYQMSQIGMEGKRYQQMKKFFSSCEEVSGRSHFLSMLYLIVHGNKNALKCLSRQEKIFTKVLQHSNYIKSRGSHTKSLLVARFSQDAKAVKRAMLELFSDFAPFAFIPKPKSWNDSLADLLFIPKNNEEYSTKKIIDHANNWLHDDVFCGDSEHVTLNKVKSNLLKFVKEQMNNMIICELDECVFLDNNDPSTLKQNYPNKFKKSTKPQLKLDLFFAHVAFPTAQNIERLDTIAKRTVTPLKTTIYNLLVGLIRSMTGWKTFSRELNEDISVQVYNYLDFRLEKFEFKVTQTLSDVREQIKEAKGKIKAIYVAEKKKLQMLKLNRPIIIIIIEINC